MMLTKGTVSGTGNALIEIPVFSCFKSVLGLENDLNISDDSFAADRLLTGFSSRSLGRSTFVSRATTALDVGPFDLSLDEDPSNGLTAFFATLLMPWLLLLAFITAEFGGTSSEGRLPVLRCFPLLGSEIFNGEETSYCDTCIINDSIFSSRY